MNKNSGWRCRTTARVAVRRLTVTAATMAVLASVAGSVSAAGPERTLAGISIFAPGSEVTRKFGNPSRILVGGVGASAVSAAGSASGSSSSPGGSSSGYPGMGGGSPSGSPGGNPGAGLLPGFGGVPTGGSSGYPGMGGSGGESPGGSPGGYSGMSSPGGSSGYPGMGGSSGGYPGGSSAVPAGPPPKQPVTLIYDRANGGSLEFTISPDKRVIQIRETGYNGAYGTSRGIRLGTSYAQVVARYGYPENTYIQGSIISTDYKDTLHCGFQFLDQKLVGIIIASPD